MASEPRELSAEDRALLERVAARVVELRMEVPAILTLETLSPMSLVAGQAMVFFEPFVAAMLRLLADNPGIEERLRAEPALIPNFVEEALRIEGVTKSTFRYVRNRVTVNGFTFEPGQHVMINIAAMNRDQIKFENPDSFDLDRKNVRSHVAFGRGLHACAGGPSQIDADVHPLRLIRLLDRDLGPLREHHQVPQLVDREAAERGDVPVGHDHQVPIVVRIQIQDDVAVRTAHEHQGVTVANGRFAEYTVMRSVGGHAGHVRQSPR